MRLFEVCIGQQEKYVWLICSDWQVCGFRIRRLCQMECNVCGKLNVTGTWRNCIISRWQLCTRQ